MFPWEGKVSPNDRKGIDPMCFLQESMPFSMVAGTEQCVNEALNTFYSQRTTIILEKSLEFTLKKEKSKPKSYLSDLGEQIAGVNEYEVLISGCPAILG